MKVLVYGFKPYKIYKQNITDFLNRIKKYKPEIILGLGQCGRGKKIAIERKAVNLMKDKTERPRIILKNKPKYLFSNWVLKKDTNSRISYYAGQYVCNFSMYVLMNYCSEQNIKYAFLHIPKDFNMKRAINFIELKLSEYLR